MSKSSSGHHTLPSLYSSVKPSSNPGVNRGYGKHGLDADFDGTWFNSSGEDTFGGNTVINEVIGDANKWIRKLTVSVITRAILDFYNFKDSDHGEKRKLAQEAEAWLRSKEGDLFSSFSSACLILGFSDEAVEHVRQSILNRTLDVSVLDHDRDNRAGRKLFQKSVNVGTPREEYAESTVQEVQSSHSLHSESDENCQSENDPEHDDM